MACRKRRAPSSYETTATKRFGSTLRDFNPRTSSLLLPSTTPCSCHVVAWAVALLLTYPDTAVRAAGSSNSNGSNSNRQRGNNKRGYQASEPFCRRNFVQVTGLWLTCDTPGAYYYGSSAYRNSEVCMSGDRANLEIQCTLCCLSDLEPLVLLHLHVRAFASVLALSHLFRFHSLQTAVSIPSTVSVQAIGLTIESGVYDNFAVVKNVTNICQDLSVTSTYSSSSSSSSHCPLPGHYTLTTYYTVPALRDYEFHYTPDVRVTFWDPSNHGRRLGCIATGTTALHRRADSRAARGVVALGISLLAFALVAASLLYLTYRRKKRLQKISERSKQNYHYFRTLPNGQVIPLPTTTTTNIGNETTQLPVGVITHPYPPTQSGQHVSLPTHTSGMIHTNPSYNEPQLPTRPIL